MKASILFCIILILYIDSYGQLRFEKDLPFYSQLNVFDIKSPKSKYLIGENAGLFLSAGFEYNGWIPYMSDYLNYTTEGFKILYVNGGLNHNVNWLPALQFKWETNFGAQHQDEILQVQNSKTQLEQGYDLFKGFLKFAEEDKDRDLRAVAAGGGAGPRSREGRRARGLREERPPLRHVPAAGLGTLRKEGRFSLLAVRGEGRAPARRLERKVHRALYLHGGPFQRSLADLKGCPGT